MASIEFAHGEEAVLRGNERLYNGLFAQLWIGLTRSYKDYRAACSS